MRNGKIMIRVNPEEHTIIEQAAGKQGVPIASWARSQLLKSARRNIHGESTLKNQASKSGKPSLSLLSLFCGPGGLDEGFRRAGFNTRIAFDIDRACVNTFNRNHATDDPIAFVRDLSTITLKEIKELAGPDFSPIGVIGGPPCQSFSVSNVHQSEEDPRHKLPEVYAELLNKLNKVGTVSFFLFENVPGLLGERHIHRYNKFKELFTKAGFEVHEKSLNAMHYNVPQDRERIFIVGINKKLHPNAVWKWPKAFKKIHTVRETIESLPEPVFNEKGRDPSTIPIHPNHWCMVPRSQKFQTPGALVEGQAWGRSFRTLQWDSPSWTVAYGNREVHVHPNGNRRLSIYEAMLLQSFPPEYVLEGNISAQVRLVSEAVAPNMAFYLAKAIKTALSFK